jgi:hypothetical protein
LFLLNFKSANHVHFFQEHKALGSEEPKNQRKQITVYYETASMSICKQTTAAAILVQASIDLAARS